MDRVEFTPDYNDDPASTPSFQGTAAASAPAETTRKTLRVADNEPSAVGYGVIGLTAAVVALAVSGHTPATLRPIDPSIVGKLFSPSKPTVALAPHLMAIQAEMEEYRHLADGWDGYNSIGPNPHTVDSALEFLRLLPSTIKPPEPTVSADGSVGWFWKSPGVFISINFPEAGRFAYYGNAQGVEARGASAFDGQAIPQDLLDVMSCA